MPLENVERKLAAILHADIKGYSRLMGADEVGTLQRLTAYREVTDALIQHHRGRIVSTAGDSILAEFASAVDAVQCAVDIQQILKTKNADLPSERRMEFRIGINVGDVIVEGRQIYGDGVNIAARLEALAEGGGICISGTVYDQTENKLALGYEYLGEQTVKNITKPMRVYRVRGEAKATATTHGRAEMNSPLQSATLALPDKPSIIVLPFINMSNDPEQEYFSDGMTEDLTTDLSKISSLFVISRNSALTYKGKAAKAQDISREMGVQYVLEGSIRKAGDRVRITAQLIDATTDHHLWSERYDRSLKDIFALQDEIVQKIVTTLKLQLTVWEQGILVRKTTENLEAYDFCLRGWESLLRLTKETYPQAQQLFERAIELDPQYALAHAGLGIVHYLEWMWQWTLDPAALDRAFEFTQRAVTLDDSLPRAHIALATVLLLKKRHEQALTEAERAIALAPNSAEGHAALGFVLAYAGRPQEAIEVLEKAIRLNPHYPALYLSYLGHAYRLAGRDEEAIMAWRSALNRNPSFPPAHVFLAATYSELGRDEEARAEAATVLRLIPSFSLEMWGQRLPYKDPAVLERVLAALRKAGLK